MLSSSPSLLLPALSPVSAAADAASVAGDAAPGFAALLNGLAAKAGEAISGEASGAEQAVAGQATPREKDKAVTVRAGRLAVAAKTDGAGKNASAAAQPAATAIETGNILPVALPEAAAAETGIDLGAETAASAAEGTSILPSLPGMPPHATNAEPAPVAPTSPRRSTAGTTPTLAHKVNPAAAQPADKARPEAQPTEGRTVAITVAAPVPIAAPVTDETVARAATPVRSKPVRAADLARVDAPLPQASAPLPVAQFAQADPSAQVANAPATNMPTPVPSPTDIDAALDHLVAAREALMPAEAALAIDHADFGEVSIKFEQAPDGRLSAELTAADPELKRAVAAAVASDRGGMTPDGDGSRSTQLAGQRGSTSGSDAATGERSQSGGQSGPDRDALQRRAPTRSQVRQTATDQRPGVFA